MVLTIQKVHSEPCHLSPHTSDLLSAHSPPSPQFLCCRFIFPVCFPLEMSRCWLSDILSFLPRREHIKEHLCTSLFSSQHYILEITS